LYLSNLKVDAKKPIDDLDFLYAEMIYFILSLPKLIETKNTYKYYFHFNIALHNYIRIDEINLGNIEYNYLPTIKYDRYKDMLFNCDSDMNTHFVKIVEIIYKLLINENGEYFSKYSTILSDFL